jgi:hypothetical protein
MADRKVRKGALGTALAVCRRENGLVVTTQPYIPELTSAPPPGLLFIT